MVSPCSSPTQWPSGCWRDRSCSRARRRASRTGEERARDSGGAALTRLLLRSRDVLSLLAGLLYRVPGGGGKARLEESPTPLSPFGGEGDAETNIDEAVPRSSPVTAC